MKTLYILVLPLLITLSCKKDELKNNISLKGQSLATVQRYTVGKWKLLSSGGGFTGNVHFEYEENYITIARDHIRWTAHDTVVVDSPLTWKAITDIYNEPAWYMMFNIDTMPFGFVPTRIENGQLHLIDNANDGFGYTLERVN
jgi:hypothetical protein